MKSNGSTTRHRRWRYLATLFMIAALLAGMLTGPAPAPTAQAQGPTPTSTPQTRFAEGIDAIVWYQEHEIEHAWRPDYLDLATGDPNSTDHGVYAWPYALDSIGWSMQSYQDYGGAPYFHHGMDMMKMYGTDVFNRSGGQVINIENYRPGWDLYWEVAILDPDGYIWQYHHVHEPTIPQYIWDKYYEYLVDPINGGFIPPDTYIGDIIEWPVWSFGKQFNHIHLNILGAGGVFINGLEFHVPLPDNDGPEIQAIGLLRNGQVYGGNEVEGDYSLYVRARDLILDNVYYLPPWEITFHVDCGSEQTTWRFDTLPGGADEYAYLDDFYVVPPTCGNYDCRDYYIDLGFIPDSQFEFPAGGGEHTVYVTVRDYAGNVDSQSFTYTVIGPPDGTPVWQDDLETELGWIPNPYGSDTATSGLWERGNPEDTNSSGPKQLGTTTSGLNDLVTGRLAGASATSYDIDGGVTSIRSPDITLPVTDALTLSFRYYLAHGSNSSAADYLQIKVVGATTTTVFEELGAAEDDDAAWALKNVNLSAFAGQTVYLLIEAADADAESLVEAAIDDIVIVALSNQPPIADPQAVATDEDTALAIVLTGSDPECAPITYSIVGGPSHGTLTGTAPNITYTPEPDYNGVDAFTFVVSDGLMLSDPAVVDITVRPVNDVPIADPQAVATAMNTPVAIVLTGSDVDGDPLTYSVTSGPSHGTLGGTAPNLTYTPAVNYLGPDAFTFVVSDGLAISDPAVVDITVQGENSPPVADSQEVTTTEDTALTIILTGSDPNDDPLTYSVVAGPDHGILGGTAPTLTYTPTADYNGADAFTFVVSDGLAVSDPAIVSITVLPVNDVPVADPQAVSTAEDTALAIVLTGSDVEGDPLTYSVTSGPSHGTLGGIAPNLVYTPTADYNGADAFTFVVSDGLAVSDPAVVSLTVQPVNDAPVADPQAMTTTQGLTVAITLTGSDIEGSELTFSVVSGPAHGTLGGTAPHLTYTPAAGYSGNDLFTFIVNDGELDSGPAVVRITIMPTSQMFLVYLPVVVRP
jgi:hypothetical protein